MYTLTMERVFMIHFMLKNSALKNKDISSDPKLVAGRVYNNTHMNHSGLAQEHAATPELTADITQRNVKMCNN